MTAKNKKSIIVNFSLPVSYAQRIKKIANRFDLSASEIVRRAIDLFEIQDNQIRFGRYGGTQVAQHKLTKAMREEERTDTIKMLQSATPQEVIDYLIEIKYLDPDREENNVLFCYRLKDDEAQGRLLYQLQINQETGDEIYSRFVFNFDELIAALIKDKKI